MLVLKVKQCKITAAQHYFFSGIPFIVTFYVYDGGDVNFVSEMTRSDVSQGHKPKSSETIWRRLMRLLENDMTSFVKQSSFWITGQRSSS